MLGLNKCFKFSRENVEEKIKSPLIICAILITINKK